MFPGYIGIPLIILAAVLSVHFFITSKFWTREKMEEVEAHVQTRTRYDFTEPEIGKALGWAIICGVLGAIIAGPIGAFSGSMLGGGLFLLRL